MDLRILRGHMGLLVVISLALPALLAGQQRGAQGPAATAQAAAPKDLTGYWVSVVTEDWQWRMVVPIKGDYAAVPINPEGRKVANAWDPSKDSEGDQCKAYGAASIMRVPGRLHISWQDGNTLRIETDSGKQTRLLHFGGAAPATVAPTLQGYSAASWEGTMKGGRNGANPGGASGADPRGYLKVITTQMTPGYLRRNGVPYSANATVEEYFDRFTEPNGDNWLIDTIVVNDPEYLNQPYFTHAQFKKIADNAGWDPTTCKLSEAR